jgi:hypothetical protein
LLSCEYVNKQQEHIVFVAAMDGSIMKDNKVFKIKDNKASIVGSLDDLVKIDPETVEAIKLKFINKYGDNYTFTELVNQDNQLQILKQSNKFLKNEFQNILPE